MNGSERQEAKALKRRLVLLLLADVLLLLVFLAVGSWVQWAALAAMAGMTLWSFRILASIRAMQGKDRP